MMVLVVEGRMRLFGLPDILPVAHVAAQAMDSYNLPTYTDTQMGVSKNQGSGAPTYTPE